jgi:hypothetical protein
VDRFEGLWRIFGF